MMLNTIQRFEKDRRDLLIEGEIVQKMNVDPFDAFSTHYMYHFKTGVVTLENPNILTADASDSLYEAILSDFKVELYSKIYKENKSDVLIKELTGLI